MNTKTKEFIAMATELTVEERTRVIIELLREQRRISDSEPSKKNLTLIDLKRGVIAGSERCPICEGFLGRSPEYLD